MKQGLLLVILCLTIAARSQNLVPNGSFEQNINCPNLITGCTDWNTYGSYFPSYYNGCHTAGGQGVPNNTFGYQAAAEGYAYAGLYTYTSSQIDAKEYITAALKSPMQVGVTYEVSMSVSLSDNSGYAGDDLAIHLYINGPTYYNQWTVLPITPKVPFYNYGAITNKQNWVRLTKLFMADSAYDHIAIGGFKAYSNMTLVTTPPGNYAYYYVDSVVIRRMRMQINYSDSVLCAGDSISAPYFGFGNGGFQSGNVFSLVLSDKNGNFGAGTVLGTSVANAGTFRVQVPPYLPTGQYYRLRLMSSSPVDSSADNGNDIHIYAPPDANATVNSPVCEGDSMVLYAWGNKPVDPGSGYRWYGPFLNGVAANPLIVRNITPLHAGYFYLLATYHGCQSRDTITVQVKPSPKNVSASTNGPVCMGSSINFYGSVSTPGVSYSWAGKNLFSSAAKDTIRGNMTAADTGMYVFTATIDGCSVSDTVYADIKPVPYPQIMSNAPLCAGDTLKLESNESVNGETYNWTGADNFISTGKAVVIADAQIKNTGKYIVVVNANGCIAADTLDVLVKPLPEQPIAKSNSPVCEGDTLDLYGEHILQGIYYEWTAPGFIIADTFIQLLSPTTAASGKYIFTAGNDGCFSSDTIDVLVKPLPVLPVIQTNSPLQTPQNLAITIKNIQTGVKYLWTGPNGFTSQQASPEIYKPGVQFSGMYNVLANLDGCTIGSQVYVQIDESVDTGYIKVYPTYCDGNFSMRGLLHSDQQVLVRIFDAGGNEVYDGFTKTDNKKLATDFNLKGRLASGIYTIHLIADNKKQVFRIVVQR